MVDEHLGLVAEALDAYRKYWIALLQAAEPTWNGLELTISQLKGLILLEVRQQTTIGEVATALAMGRPSASTLIEQLVQLGLVERTEDRVDRRRTLVKLSARGKDLAARLHRGDEEFMRRWLMQICNEDLIAFRRALQALAAAAIPPPSDPGE